MIKITKYKAPTKFIQYQLWHDCRIGCKFCCNKKQPDLDKIESLQFILNKLNDPEVYEYDEVGFIGGEFFDNQLENSEVKDLFYKLFEKISKLHFKKIYFTTALIFDRNLYLIPFLNYLKELKILDKCLLCTSYDFKYRFNTKKRLKTWENTMLFLQEAYPELRLHTEIILMQPFIDAVLNNSFSITAFKEKYKTGIDYIEPGSGLYYHDKKEAAKDLPDFFPTKNSFIKFLKKVAVENKEIDLSTFLSMELRSSKLYYIDGGKMQVFENRRDSDGRGRPLDKTKKYEIGFIDSEDTMQDIATEFYKMLKE